MTTSDKNGYTGEDSDGKVLYVRAGGPPSDWMDLTSLNVFVDGVKLDAYIVAADAENGFVVFYPRNESPDHVKRLLTGDIRIEANRKPQPTPRRESTRNPLDYNRNGTM